MIFGTVLCLSILAIAISSAALDQFRVLCLGQAPLFPVGRKLRRAALVTLICSFIALGIDLASLTW